MGINCGINSKILGGYEIYLKSGLICIKI